MGRVSDSTSTVARCDAGAALPRKVIVRRSGRGSYLGAVCVIQKQHGTFQPMDIKKMLDELRIERAMIEESMLALERLALGRGKRRGRPPQWMTTAGAKRRGRPPGSKNRPKTEARAA